MGESAPVEVEEEKPAEEVKPVEEPPKVEEKKEEPKPEEKEEEEEDEEEDSEDEEEEKKKAEAEAAKKKIEEEEKKKAAAPPKIAPLSTPDTNGPALRRRKKSADEPAPSLFDETPKLSETERRGKRTCGHHDEDDSRFGRKS